MTAEVHPAGRGRILVLVPHNGVAEALTEQASDRPIVALLESTEQGTDDLDPVIQTLLGRGCEYFVCWGADSEALHDRVDDLLLDDTTPTERTVMTTWHDDEPAGDVAEFFFNVAAEKNGTLMVAVLNENDSEMARLLTRQASIAD